MVFMMKRSGFTLIEIIIVVAILGILAIGLLTALNPIEQISRAIDTTSQTLAREFMSAAGQFQTNKGYSAACPDISCLTYRDSLNATSSVPFATLSTVNTVLESAGVSESATNFIGHPQASQVFASVTDVTAKKDAIFVLCWKPQSSAIKSDADVGRPYTTIYNDVGAVQTASACPADSSNNCYRCLRQ